MTYLQHYKKHCRKENTYDRTCAYCTGDSFPTRKEIEERDAFINK